MSICPKCNIEYKEGKKFCMECGSPLEEKTAKPFCSNCNIEYEEGKKFCKECGAAITEKFTQAPAPAAPPISAPPSPPPAAQPPPQQPEAAKVSEKEPKQQPPEKIPIPYLKIALLWLIFSTIAYILDFFSGDLLDFFENNFGEDHILHKIVQFLPLIILFTIGLLLIHHFVKLAMNALNKKIKILSSKGIVVFLVIPLLWVICSSLLMRIRFSGRYHEFFGKDFFGGLIPILVIYIITGFLFTFGAIYYARRLNG